MNIKDVEDLAKLARIELVKEEKEELLSDMDNILEYVKQIEAVEISPKVGTEDYNFTNVWREDKIESRDFSKEIILEQFPDAQDGFLKVKKIL